MLNKFSARELTGQVYSEKGVIILRERLEDAESATVVYLSSLNTITPSPTLYSQSDQGINGTDALIIADFLRRSTILISLFLYGDVHSFCLITPHSK